MPQLNPAPWLTMLITAWATVALLMKLTMNNTKINPPHHMPATPSTKHWPWTWQ